MKLGTRELNAILEDTYGEAAHKALRDGERLLDLAMPGWREDEARQRAAAYERYARHHARRAATSR